MNILSRWLIYDIYLYPISQFSFPFQKPVFINSAFPGMPQDDDAEYAKQYMGRHSEQEGIYVSLNQRMFQRKFMGNGKIQIETLLRHFWGKFNKSGLLNRKTFKRVNMNRLFCNSVLKLTFLLLLIQYPSYILIF
jgi:hypothetical protein